MLTWRQVRRPVATWTIGYRNHCRPASENIAALEKPATAEPKTVRETLTQQRANTVCASCHSRDPMGFARENYFIGGREIRMKASRSTTAANCRTGRVPAGPQRLKAALLERKDLFVSNVTAKMLGYALGRGLTPQDSCEVDRIVAELRENDYRAQKLVELVVLSAPFQYQAPSASKPKPRQGT